jgi:hypothetical protein
MTDEVKRITERDVTNAYERGKAEGVLRGLSIAAGKCVQFARETMSPEAQRAYINASEALDDLRSDAQERSRFDRERQANNSR